MNTPIMNRTVLNQYMQERLREFSKLLLAMPCVASVEELRTVREAPAEFHVIELNFTLVDETLWKRLEVYPYRIEPAADFGTPLSVAQLDAMADVFKNDPSMVAFGSLFNLLREQGRARLWSMRTENNLVFDGSITMVELNGYLMVDATELEGPLWEDKTIVYGIPFKFRY